MAARLLVSKRTGGSGVVYTCHKPDKAVLPLKPPAIEPPPACTPADDAATGTRRGMQPTGGSEAALICLRGGRESSPLTLKAEG